MFSFSKASRQFKSLSDESRLRIYTIIVVESGKCDMDETEPLALNTVTGLTSLSGLAQSTVSHHVKILTAAGIIEPKRKNNKKYLFPTKKAATYLEHITSLYADALANDKEIYSDVAAGYIFEQNDYTEAIDFISSHGYLAQGPTSLESSYGAVRFHLYKKKKKNSISVEITYTPVDGSISLGVLKRFISELKDETTEITKLINKFASAKAELGA